MTKTKFIKLKEYAFILPVSPNQTQIGTTQGKGVVLGLNKEEVLQLTRILDGSTNIDIAQNLMSDSLGVSIDWTNDLLEKLHEASLLEELPEESLSCPHRYQSQLKFWGIFTDQKTPASVIQNKLKSKTVTVIGAGGVGCHAMTAFATAGVGVIRVIDYDTISESNLNRQILYRKSDIGSWKHSAAAKRLSEINPDIKIESQKLKVASVDDAKAAAKNSDFVLCAADYPFILIQRWINKACLELGIPWMSARFGEASCDFGPLVVPGKTACFECFEQMLRKNNKNYDFQVDEFLSSSEGTEDTYHRRSATIGAYAGVVGNLAAWEVIRYLTNICEPATYDCSLTLDFVRMTFSQQTISRQKDCTECLD